MSQQVCLNVNLGCHSHCSIPIRCSDLDKRVVTIYEYGHASSAKCNTAPREILYYWYTLLPC